MTLEDATQLKTSLNTTLSEAGNTTLTYGVYAYWTQAAEKEYNVILYPIQHKVKYEAANTSGQFSVVRVSLATQLKGSQSDEAFVNTFNAAVAKDDEANNLLNK